MNPELAEHSDGRAARIRPRDESASSSSSEPLSNEEDSSEDDGEGPGEWGEETSTSRQFHDGGVPMSRQGNTHVQLDGITGLVRPVSSSTTFQV